MQEDIRNQPTKKAMYKIKEDGTFIAITKDKRGFPVIIEYNPD